MFLRFIIVALCLFISIPAYAEGPRRCGEIDKGWAKDLYDDAKDLRFIIDLRGDIEESCDALDFLYVWEKRQGKDFLKWDVYISDKEQVLNDFQSHFSEIESQFAVLDAWRLVDVDGSSADYIKKRDAMGGSIKRLEKAQYALHFAREELFELTKF